MLIIYRDSNQPSGIPDQFSGTNLGNTATLTISGARAEDEVDYYCAIYHGSGSSLQSLTVTQTDGEVKHKPSYPGLTLSPAV